MADQRDRQPTAHGWMFIDIGAKVLPARMRFQLGLGHAHGLIGLADHGIDAAAAGQGVEMAPLRVFLGKRHAGDGLAPVFTLGHADYGLVSPYDQAGLLGNGVHGGFHIGRRGNRSRCFGQCLELGHAAAECVSQMIAVALGMQGLGSIPQGQQKAEMKVVFHERYGSRTSPELCAVAAYIPALAVHMTFRSGRLPFLMKNGTDEVFGVEQEFDGLPDHLGLAPAEQRLGTGIPAGQSPVQVRGNDGVIRSAVEDRSEEGLMRHTIDTGSKSAVLRRRQARLASFPAIMTVPGSERLTPLFHGLPEHVAPGRLRITGSVG